jgi:DNA-directed RNA polymerase alpha subunit
VTAGDIQTDGTVDVINKDHVIAELTGDVPLVVEMVVENGRGYVPRAITARTSKSASFRSTPSTAGNASPLRD